MFHPRLEVQETPKPYRRQDYTSTGKWLPYRTMDPLNVGQSTKFLPYIVESSERETNSTSLLLRPMTKFQLDICFRQHKYFLWSCWLFFLNRRPIFLEHTYNFKEFTTSWDHISIVTKNWWFQPNWRNKSSTWIIAPFLGMKNQSQQHIQHRSLKFTTRLHTAWMVGPCHWTQREHWIYWQLVMQTSLGKVIMQLFLPRFSPTPPRHCYGRLRAYF